MLRGVGIAALAGLGGCALIDAASGPGGDGDADSDSDTDTGTGTGMGTESDTDTGTGSDTDTDTGTGTEILADCFEPDRTADICEDQTDHAAECLERDARFAGSVCDPIDQCECVAPQACYQTSPVAAPSAESACADPGSEAEGAICAAHVDCGEGLFCLDGSISETGSDACTLPCDDPCDCSGDEVCLPFTPPFCHLPDLCDPAAEDPCPIPGEACIAFVDNSRRTFATTCLRGPLDIPVGDPCVSTNSCVPGSQCFDGLCKRACHATADCEDGQECLRVDNITGCFFEIKVCE